MTDLKEILQSRDVVIPENFSVFKDIFKHFRGKQVQDIDGDKRPLLEKAEDFYLVPPDKGFLQGDILNNISPTWLQNDNEGSLSAYTSKPTYCLPSVIVKIERLILKLTLGFAQYMRKC